MDEFDESGTISSKKGGGYFRAKIGNTSFFFLPLLLIVATEFKGGGQGGVWEGETTRVVPFGD